MDLSRCDDAVVRSERALGLRPAHGFTGRDRSKAWWLLGASAVIAALWAAVQLLGASVPLLVQVLVAVAAAVIAVVVPELRARRQQDDERRRVMASHLRLLADDGRLPLVGEIADPGQLGVTRSERLPEGKDGWSPYVRRAKGRRA
jgi:hypothetical protein